MFFQVRALPGDSQRTLEQRQSLLIALSVMGLYSGLAEFHELFLPELGCLRGVWTPVSEQ